jgi:hypothetical protein
MKISRITKGLILLTAMTGTFAVGCELIVDFDRTKIPVEATPDAADAASVPVDGATPPNDSGGATGSDAGDSGGQQPSDAAADG